MEIELSQDIYSMKSLSESRKAFKEYLDVKVSKKTGKIHLELFVLKDFSSNERKEIINSFNNYLIQHSAIKKLGLES